MATIKQKQNVWRVLNADIDTRRTVRAHAERHGMTTAQALAQLVAAGVKVFGGKA